MTNSITILMQDAKEDVSEKSRDRKCGAWSRDVVSATKNKIRGWWLSYLCQLTKSSCLVELIKTIL